MHTPEKLYIMNRLTRCSRSLTFVFFRPKTGLKTEATLRSTSFSKLRMFPNVPGQTIDIIDLRKSIISMVKLNHINST